MNFILLKRKKVVDKFKIETPKNIWIEEFVCFRSKAFSFKCNDNNENKKKIKGISESQSKHIKYEECKKMFIWGRIPKKM